MPRSGEDAKRRLQGAALELWSEHGYDRTTTAEIAARAGVTERTFFRHFSDKREVLFDGAAAMRAILTDALTEAPAETTPMQALLHAFAAVEPLFEENQPYAGVRQRVIAETPALQERELAKAALLTGALAEALERRGVDARLAVLASQAGIAAFNHAFVAWLNNPAVALRAHLERSFDTLRALASGEQPSAGTIPAKSAATRVDPQSPCRGSR